MTVMSSYSCVGLKTMSNGCSRMFLTHRQRRSPNSGYILEGVHSETPSTLARKVNRGGRKEAGEEAIAAEIHRAVVMPRSWVEWWGKGKASRSV